VVLGSARQDVSPKVPTSFQAEYRSGERELRGRYGTGNLPQHLEAGWLEMIKYRIEIEVTNTGFSAYSPDVPGVGVAGKTREEVETLLREAIALQLEDRVPTK
jgi:predicted RNase H-like HicB family nuclease